MSHTILKIGDIDLDLDLQGQIALQTCKIFDLKFTHLEFNLHNFKPFIDNSNVLDKLETSDLDLDLSGQICHIMFL